MRQSFHILSCYHTRNYRLSLKEPSMMMMKGIIGRFIYRITGIFRGFHKWHDICEIIFRKILLAGQRLSDRCSPNFLIHVVPSNIAMKNIDKFALGYSRRSTRFNLKEHGDLEPWIRETFICEFALGSKLRIFCSRKFLAIRYIDKSIVSVIIPADIYDLCNLVV